MNKNEALDILKKYITNENLIKHSLASWAVMRSLANKLGEDKEKWGLAGILHDIDVELTKEDPKEHTKKAVDILKSLGITDDIIEAIKMHNEEAWETKSDEKFHIALRCSETVTGLITATAFIMPDKKLNSVKPESVIKRFKDKRFAAGARRENIKECEKLGIGLNDFLSLSLSAMKEISDELGL